jgi:hypothetical protein
MNIREILDTKEAYWSFCREERNLAAILYHMLLCGDNVERFCRAVGYQPRLWDSAVYFEYAYLRDLWSCLGGTHKGSPQVPLANDRKRHIIIEMLRPSAAGDLVSCGIAEFNDYFGAVPKASTWCIQSPSNWSLPRFRKNIPDPEEFLRTCMFKWAFNAKPDIVIHADADHALCIEAKLESGEGQYPATSVEKAIFDELGLARVSQTRLQRYLMQDLLGIDTEFLFLTAKADGFSPEKRTLSWAAAFSAVELGDQPGFVNAWIKGVLGLG